VLLAKRNKDAIYDGVTVEQIMDLVFDLRDEYLNSLMSAVSPEDAEQFRQKLLCINRVVDFPDAIKNQFHKGETQ
jgi:hypothetical protein